MTIALITMKKMKSQILMRLKSLTKGKSRKSVLLRRRRKKLKLDVMMREGRMERISKGIEKGPNGSMIRIL